MVGYDTVLSSVPSFIHQFVHSFIHARASRGCMHRADAWRSGDPFWLREVGVSMMEVGGIATASQPGSRLLPWSLQSALHTGIL